MLFYDFVEARVVELGKEGEVVDVGNDDGQSLFEFEEALFECVRVFGVAVEFVV